MRVTRTIDATTDELEDAKQSAVSFLGDSSPTGTLDLFYTENLDELERGIKNLNEFSSKAWLLSSLLLYTLIYNEELYRQSGLDWFHYSRQSRERLGLDNREITEQLSAARFYIKHHKALERKGFKVNGSSRKLARAELALHLCGDIDETIGHLVNDTWSEFNAWYSSFKEAKKIEQNAGTRADIRVDGDRFIIGDIDAVTISSDIAESDRERLKGYMRAIFETLSAGYEPAIVATYDKKEAALMPKLRDKFRRGK